MVSVIFWVVSVLDVIDPWVKFGTTGTARAGASVTLTPTALRTDQRIIVFIITILSQ
jgi:hypothetical protein